MYNKSCTCAAQSRSSVSIQVEVVRLPWLKTSHSTLTQTDVFGFSLKTIPWRLQRFIWTSRVWWLNSFRGLPDRQSCSLKHGLTDSTVNTEPFTFEVFPYQGSCRLVFSATSLHFLTLPLIGLFFKSCAAKCNRKRKVSFCSLCPTCMKGVELRQVIRTYWGRFTEEELCFHLLPLLLNGGSREPWEEQFSHSPEKRHKQRLSEEGKGSLDLCQIWELLHLSGRPPAPGEVREPARGAAGLGSLALRVNDSSGRIVQMSHDCVFFPLKLKSHMPSEPLTKISSRRCGTPAPEDQVI